MNSRRGRSEKDKDKDKGKGKGKDDDAVAEGPSVPEPPIFISVGELYVLKTFISLAVQRGAIRADEMAIMGQVYDKLVRIVGGGEKPTTQPPEQQQQQQQQRQHQQTETQEERQKQLDANEVMV